MTKLREQTDFSHEESGELREMRRYLSFGGGIDSTALMLLLTDGLEKFETLFVDHGTDMPETYEYVKYLQDEGYPITVIKPNVQGFSDLYEFCWHKRILPSIMGRWCSDKFKVRPQTKYRKRPCIIYLGYDASEKRRALKVEKLKRKGETYRFPLIEKGITRRLSCEIIRKHKLRIPLKSGCYFCPLQKKRKWKQLLVNHPDLFRKAMLLEEHCKNPKMTLLPNGKKLSSLWQENKLTKYLTI